MRFTFFALAACLALAAVPSESGAKQPKLDILIRGGVVHDGSGAPGRTIDVGIKGDRIVFVGDGSKVRASRTIDATGLLVAPGFIDPHTHSLSDLVADDRDKREVLNHVSQGVTTILVGNDGDGAFEVAKQAERFERLGVGVNVGAFAGFGAVREAVVGEVARAPTPAELETMRGLVAQGMCEGAFGFSTGLYYAPQSFSQTEEVVALAREAGLQGGLYETHLREEGKGLLTAAEEALRIGREADLPVHLAHIKALGADAQGLSKGLIDMVERERAAGRRVTADQYPWRASGTRVSNALIPRWTQDRGRSAMLERLADPALQERLQREVSERIAGRGGPQSLLITSGPQKGRDLGQAATELGLTPAETALRIAREGDARLASFNMREDEIRDFMVQPWVVTASDATIGHPRRFGSFANKFALYVRETPLLSVQDFVHRSTGLTAEIFGIEQRGLLRDGYFADVVVFDPRQFAARATYADPERHSIGVRYTFVNGKAVVDGGAATHALAGDALRKAASGNCS